jgi:hypothetical protein
MASASTFTPYGIGSHYFCCNVIMNHRGPDVEKGFPRHLYRRLIVHELGVLLDAEELQRVDNLTSQIEGAIRTASVHIAVLSSGYAESSWCLNELVFMSESGSAVLLLFYNVNPSELRWMEGGDGVYVRTLLILEKYSTFDFYPRYDSHAIEEWRDFLSVVVEIRRFELNACNGGEGQLVCKFGQPELENVSKTPLNVAKYPTGVDEKVKKCKGNSGSWWSWKNSVGKRILQP